MENTYPDFSKASLRSFAFNKSRGQSSNNSGESRKTHQPRFANKQTWKEVQLYDSEQPLNEQYYDELRYNEPRYNEQRYNDQQYNEPRYNDQRCNEQRPNEQRYNKIQGSKKPSYRNNSISEYPAASRSSKNSSLVDKFEKISLSTTPSVAPREEFYGTNRFPPSGKTKAFSSNYHNNKNFEPTNNNNTRFQSDNSEFHNSNNNHKQQQYYNEHPSHYSKKQFSHFSHNKSSSSFSNLSQAFPGTTSLVGILDKKISVVLRDGKKLFGILRTYDQYGTIVLYSCVERIYLNQQYAEQYYGIYIIRGENIAFIGEFENNIPFALNLEKRPFLELLSKKKEALEESRKLALLKKQANKDFQAFDLDYSNELDA